MPGSQELNAMQYSWDSLSEKRAIETAQRSTRLLNRIPVVSRCSKRPAQAPLPPDTLEVCPRALGAILAGGRGTT